MCRNKHNWQGKNILFIISMYLRYTTAIDPILCKSGWRYMRVCVMGLSESSHTICSTSNSSRNELTQHIMAIQIAVIVIILKPIHGRKQFKAIVICISTCVMSNLSCCTTGYRAPMLRKQYTRHHK